MGSSLFYQIGPNLGQAITSLKNRARALHSPSNNKRAGASTPARLETWEDLRSEASGSVAELAAWVVDHADYLSTCTYKSFHGNHISRAWSNKLRLPAIGSLMG